MNILPGSSLTSFCLFFLASLVLQGVREHTPLKTNLSPENQGLEDVFPTEIVPLLRDMRSFSTNIISSFNPSTIQRSYGTSPQISCEQKIGSLNTRIRSMGRNGIFAYMNGWSLWDQCRYTFLPFVPSIPKAYSFCLMEFLVPSVKRLFERKSQKSLK